VSRYAELQSLPTHSGPAARAGSIAVAVGVALSLQGFPKETILRTASALARRADEVLADRLLRAGSLSSDPEEALAEIGTSPAVYEAVPAAFYCFLRFGPEEALMVGASGGGDTDSVASIAGALAGAACGTSWIPERWLSILEDRERLERTAQNLAELSASFTLGRGEFISAGRGESV
jgi:ADP-ribosylglycohydrolase